MSQLQVDSITNLAGTGSPNFPFGFTGIPGIGTSGVFTPVSYPFTITSSHKSMVILVDTTTARVINMPAHEAGFIVTIKDITGSAGTNNISLVRSGGLGNIEGVAATFFLDQNRICATFISDGGNWHMIA